MIRLLLVVEGKTEQTFVKDVLAPHLTGFGVFAPLPRCVETGRKRGRIFRGGMTTYDRARKDLTLWMKEDRNPDAFFSTMFDLYRLPPDFPGCDEATKLADPLQRVACLERCFADVTQHQRFVPYIQLHEFEALLFAEPGKFAGRFPDRQAQIDKLAAIAREFPTPEHIDDGEGTAPSKRIAAVLPEYDKPSAGPMIAANIGLTTLRAKCAHFSEWVSKLEKLGSLKP